MRATMADYVGAVHQAYVDAAALLPPGDRARLPLLGMDRFTVAAVGTRYLHVVASDQNLPAPVGQEVVLPGEIAGLTWDLRFFDPVIVPELGLIDESEHAAPQRVRDILGIRSVAYHILVPPGSGLTAHHAQHAGTGLAHSHAAADRDFDTMLGLAPQHESLIAEMHAAQVNSMPHALRLLANELNAPATIGPEVTDLADIRRQALALLRARVRGGVS